MLPQGSNALPILKETDDLWQYIHDNLLDSCTLRGPNGPINKFGKLDKLIGRLPVPPLFQDPPSYVVAPLGNKVNTALSLNNCGGTWKLQNHLGYKFGEPSPGNKVNECDAPNLPQQYAEYRKAIPSSSTGEETYDENLSSDMETESQNFRRISGFQVTKILYFRTYTYGLPTCSQSSRLIHPSFMATCILILKKTKTRERHQCA